MDVKYLLSTLTSIARCERVMAWRSMAVHSSSSAQYSVIRREFIWALQVDAPGDYVVPFSFEVCQNSSECEPKRTSVTVALSASYQISNESFST